MILKARESRNGEIILLTERSLFMAVDLVSLDIITITKLKENKMKLELVRDLEQQGLKLKLEGKGTEASHNTAKLLFEFIYLYEEHLPVFNAAKKKMDEAYIAKNVVEFQNSLNEFKRSTNVLYTAKKKLRSRRKMSRLKIHTPLFESAMDKCDFVEKTIMTGEKWVKRANMSPAQIEAANKASQRMSAMWG